MFNHIEAPHQEGVAMHTMAIHSQAFKDVTTWGKEQILSGRPQHKIYKQ